MLPNFIVIGAQKSGSTSLRYYLQEHPDICLYPKESHFFDDETKHVFGVEYYERLFDDCCGDKAIGEVTPCYIYAQMAPGRMYETLPGAKLILIMRNPIDRAYSHYWKNIQNGREVLTFEDAIGKENERIGIDNWHMMNYSYMNRGIYYRQIERFLEHYSIQNMLFLLFEEFIQDVNGTLQEIYGFLGIDSQFSSTRIKEVKNKAKMSKSKLLFRLAKGDYESPKIIKKIMYASRVQYLLRLVNNKINVKEIEYPQMDLDIRQWLLDFYHRPNLRLGKLLNLDLSIWGE